LLSRVPKYGDGTGNTIENSSLLSLLPNLKVLAAISKGKQAVKLCFNKVLQFLNVGAS